MRHRKDGFKLGRLTQHRWAMFRNLLTGLFRHERIETTEAKAKAVRGLADHIVTLAKRENLHARRQVLQLVPDTEVHSSEKAAEVAEEARKLLQRVIDDHPGTPWALLAQREIKDPFGFKWVETYVPPPPKPGNNPNNPARKKAQEDMKPARPPVVPKL